LKNAKLELLVFGYIDPQYVSEAETKIKHQFGAMDLKLDHVKYTEIAIIPKNKMKTIKEHYEMVSKIYMGHIAELINKIQHKDNEIKLLQKEHENELLKKDLVISQLNLSKKDCENELSKKDNELSKKDYETELLKKDLLIAQLKATKNK